MKRYKKSQLSKTIRKYIATKEKELNRKCGMIWEFTNPKGDTYLFANFNRNRDNLIVTVGYYEPRLHHFVKPQ